MFQLNLSRCRYMPSHWILLIGISLVCPAVLSSQPIIRWGNEMFKPASSSAFKVIGNWNDGVMLQIRTSDRLFLPGKAFIQRLDDMTMLPQFNQKVQLETAKGDKSLEYQVLEKLGENPVLFASYFNKDRDKIELYGRKYNIDGEPVGKDRKIAELKAARKSQLEGLNFVHSSDSLRMLTFFTQRWDKYEHEKIQFILFNKELEIDLNRNVEFPYSGDSFSIHDAAVDNNGRIYLLIRLAKQKQGKWFKKNLPDYQFNMVTFDNDSSLVEDYEIILPDKRVTDIQFLPEPNGIITCAGFYANNENQQSDGVFFLKIDRNKAVVSDKHFTPFKGALNQSFRMNSTDRTFPDFKMGHFIRWGDSAYVVIAEERMVDEVCYQDFRTGMVNCNYVYNFNDIVAIKLNLDGVVEWVADIPKIQESINDGGKYASYVFVQNQQNLYFIYNDHPLNAKAEPSTNIIVMDDIKKAVPVMATVYPNGSYTRSGMPYEKRNKFWMLPSSGCQISPNSVFLISVSANKYKTGILPLGSTEDESVK